MFKRPVWVEARRAQEVEAVSESVASSKGRQRYIWIEDERRDGRKHVSRGKVEYSTVEGADVGQRNNECSLSIALIRDPLLKAAQQKITSHASPLLRSNAGRLKRLSEAEGPCISGPALSPEDF